MNELPYIEKWIYQTLSTDVTLAALIGTRVYNEHPPTGTAFPYVVFAHISPRDVQGNGAVRLMTRPLYLIKAVAKGSMSAALQSIANRVDDILQNTASVVFEGFVLSIRREGSHKQREPGPEAETFYMNLGGFFRIDTQRNI